MEKTNEDVSARRKWLRLGLFLAVLQYLFLSLVIALLEIDLYLAVIVTIGVSIVGGIAFMIFVLYFY